ncbi:MAG: sensor histidine kinase, partial [Clostridia bacterium]|nr:sensor histidine kinase [Clostridia bacterium]
FGLLALLSALGAILRYAIDRSNKSVTVREELTWMSRYVYLQQTRLKNGFAYQTDVEEDCLNCRVHKLLFQPFVENAILHGFEGVHGVCRLSLSIARQGSELLITIADNGKGMTTEKARDVFDERADAADNADDRTHIGIHNAMTRLKMYYADRAQIAVESVPGKGTTITLRIPVDNGEGGQTA